MNPLSGLLCTCIVTLVVAAGADAASAATWTRRYINSLPDAAFASIETTPEGKKVRHLPHHDRSGRVDLPHVRNALSRLPQVQWVDAQHAAAAHEHLLHHLREQHQREPAYSR